MAIVLYGVILLGTWMHPSANIIERAELQISAPWASIRTREKPE